MVSVSTRDGKAQQEGPEELDRALEQIDAEEADYWSRLLDRACEVERNYLAWRNYMQLWP